MSTDVGTSGGSTGPDDVVWSLTAKGADVWGTSDQFGFASEPFNAANGSLAARVRSVQNVNAWTKAGVMFREGTSSTQPAANAKYVFVMVTPGKGITMQYRSTTGGSAAALGAAVAGTAPAWARLMKTGVTYVGQWSIDGTTWTSFGSVTIAMDRAKTQAGLALTSHDPSTATASFDDVTFE
jgi:hypothetical protein